MRAKTDTQIIGVTWDWTEARAGNVMPGPVRTTRNRLIIFKKSKRYIDLYSTPSWEAHLWSAGVWITQFYTANTPYTCLRRSQIIENLLPVREINLKACILDNLA